MPRGPIQPYKQRRGPILDNFLLKSVELSNGQHNTETGHYTWLTIEGAKTKEDAQAIVQALYRCKFHVNKKLKPKIGLHSEIVKNANGTFDVKFAAVDLAFAKAAVIAKYGDDPNGWAYNPRAKAQK